MESVLMAKSGLSEIGHDGAATGIRIGEGIGLGPSGSGISDSGSAQVATFTQMPVAEVDIASGRTTLYWKRGRDVSNRGVAMLIEAYFMATMMREKANADAEGLLNLVKIKDIERDGIKQVLKKLGYDLSDEV